MERWSKSVLRSAVRRVPDWLLPALKATPSRLQCDVASYNWLQRSWATTFLGYSVLWATAFFWLQRSFGYRGRIGGSGMGLEVLWAGVTRVALQVTRPGQ